MAFDPPPVRCWWSARAGLAARRLRPRRKAKGRKRKAKVPARRLRRAEPAKGAEAPTDVARKYLIETFGCQMNVHDSERMAGLLEQAGFEATADAGDADVVVRSEERR